MTAAYPPVDGKYIRLRAEDYFEPAVAITHNDGNPSTILRYVSSEQKAVAGGTETTIQLKDDQYPVEVTLHYIAYPKEKRHQDVE